MPFEIGRAGRPRVAVIGGGVSGLAAAELLSVQANVVLYEAEPRLGGHARTVLAGRRGNQPVDTGFIVFNRVNYPRLTALFDRLGVEAIDSNMSFSASIQGGRLEYALTSMNTLFTQRRRLADPRYLRMLRDIVKFNKHASGKARDPGETLAELLDRMRLGRWFRDHYLLPFSGAIWSSPVEQVLDFPAWTMVRFFENHNLLNYSGQHQWLTMKGGSQVYVDRLAQRLGSAGVDLRVGAPVAGVRRFDDRAEVRAVNGDWESFDEVVFATHGDTSFSMLVDPTPEERATLGQVRYQPNRAVLHADRRLMPRNRRCWSSWNYTEAPGPRPERIGLTYWMNALQSIPEDDPLFLTLNPQQPIAEELIYDEVTFSHPLYSLDMMAAQARLDDMQGARRSWYCGAWTRNGFHEDGMESAARVVTGMEAGGRLARLAAA